MSISPPSIDPANNPSIAHPGGLIGVEHVPRVAGATQGVLMCLNTVLIVMGGFLVAPVLPEIQHEFRNIPHSELLVGLTLTAPGAFMALFSPLAGALADRLGRRFPLIVALLFYALCGCAPLVLHSLYGIALSRCLVGVVEAVLMTCSTALLSDYFSPEKRQTWISIRGFIATIAVGAMLIVAGLADFKSWRTPFGIYAASLLLVVPTMLFTWETTSVKAATRQHREVLPWAHMAKIGWLAVFGSVIFSVVPFQLGFVLAARGIPSPADASLATGIGIACGPIGSLLPIWIGRRAPGRLLAAAMGVMGLALFIVANARTFILIVAGVGLQQIGGSLMLAAALIFCLNGLSPGVTARGVGIWWLLYGVGNFLTPALTTGLIALTGTPMSALDVLGILCLVACLPLLLLRSPAIRT